MHRVLRVLQCHGHLPSPTASAQVVPILQQLDEKWPRAVAVIRGPHSAPQVGRLSMVLVSAQMQ